MLTQEVKLLGGRDNMKYIKKGEEIGRLVTEKQIAYGDSFTKSGEIMNILYPDGINAAQMDDALTLIRIIDKLFRIATHYEDRMGESPYNDIAGYAILAAVRAEEKSS